MILYLIEFLTYLSFLFYLGRAPWGYHDVKVIKNLSFDSEGHMICPPETSCVLNSEECLKQHGIPETVARVYCPEVGYWQSSNGHIIAWVKPKVGDSFFPCNSPAHIQGAVSHILSAYTSNLH